MAYLLDTSVFVTAKRVHYGFDFCPGFWDWIVHQYQPGNLYSVQAVRDELKDQQDDLAVWARGCSPGFFLAPDQTTAGSFATVTGWATAQHYTDGAIHTLLSAADFYLAAQALQGGHVVVTYEKASNSINRIKIPDACAGMGVHCVQPYEHFRREGARFVHRVDG